MGLSYSKQALKALKALITTATEEYDPDLMLFVEHGINIQLPDQLLHMRKSLRCPNKQRYVQATSVPDLSDSKNQWGGHHVGAEWPMDTFSRFERRR